MRSSVMIRWLLSAFSITVVFSLDSAVFHRIFNGTLTSGQIEQLADEYNEGVKTGAGKEMGLAFISSVHGVEQAVIDKFLDVWRKDLMLRSLHGAAMQTIKDDITKDLKKKVN
ncbi:hypothetical protein OESDEN_01672 [Oesophagostomum dentatum]|uniref:Nematode fatty acid retinoid binding protein n=1 Tax=Oesophagostomum dentatum TaxID=61180 RepID=A0A0B1TQF0_OESDE|nr:hypothetical protein OESDEN_01672 [Oesophagostomum dentatum]